MARTVKSWRKEVRAAFEMEHCTDVKFEPLGSTHQCASATYAGKRVSITISLSPSDTRAIHRVRADVRSAIRKLREAT